MRKFAPILALLSLVAGLFVAMPVGAASCACKEIGTNVFKRCVSDQKACDELCGGSNICTCLSDLECPETGEQPVAPTGKPVGIPMPLGNITLAGAIGRTIRVILGLTGTMALAVFVYAGFMYMTAAGSQEKVSKAKTMMVWSILGIIVVFSAYSAVNFIIERLTT